MTTMTADGLRRARGAARPDRPATRSTRRARTRPSTCSGCSTTGSCGSPRRPSTTRTGTGSCSPRATGRPAYYAVLAAKGFIPRRLARRPGPCGQPARPPPGPAAGARRGDRLRLARPRAGARRRHRARPARPGPTEPPGVRPARRRRTGRGLQPRGDRVRGRDRAGRPHRDRDRQPVRHPRLARRHRHAGSPSTAGPRATVDGRDHDAIEAALARARPGPAARGRRGHRDGRR